MHEVSLMEQTLNVALAAADRQHAQTIHRLKLRVGAMSGVVAEALEFAFEIVTRDTIAQGAILEIETVPVVCHCPQCQADFQPADWIFECPTCGTLTTQIRSGKEIELASLEVS